MKATKRIGVKAWIGAMVLFAVASCKNSSDTATSAGDEYGFKQPVVSPLVFSKPQKINWDKAKTNKVTPVFDKFDIDKIPAEPYTDTTAFKPFQYPVGNGKFDYSTLPSKDLGISKLPSKPFKFAPSVVYKPQLTNTGPPRPSAKSRGLLFELSESQGLAGVVITCVFTDRDGFVWAASDKGLYRYDGQNLVLFVPDPLSRIFCMLQDSSGQIWMSSLDGGLAILDPKTGVLKLLTQKQGLLADKLIKMLIDDKQRVWATSQKGINIIDTKAQTISILGQAQGLSDSRPGFITTDHNNIWVATNTNGINIIDLKANKIRYLRRAQGLISDTLSTIFCDRQGRIWATNGIGVGITVFDVTHGTVQHISELGNLKNTRGNFLDVQTITQDNKGNIWVGTVANGIYILNLDKRLIKKIIVSGRVGDQADFVVCVSHDKEGNSWIATVNGLYVYKPNPALIEHIRNYSVSTIAEDDNGLIWEGDFSGVHIVDRKNKTTRWFTTRYGLVNDSVQNILNANGKVFVTTNNGTDIFDVRTKMVERLGSRQGLPFRQANTVLIDKVGNFIISSGRGVLIFNPNTGISKLIDKDNGLSENNITDITLDEQNKIWAGAQNGSIDIIDSHAGTVSHLDQPGLRTNGTKLFLHNSSGNIWIGTTKGAYMVDQKNKTLTTFSTAQGLADQGVISLLQHNRRIYVGGNGGISVITPPTASGNQNKEWRVLPFGKDDGLNKANTGYYLSDNITKDGLYIWGDNGVTIADLSSKANKRKAVVSITGFNLMDKPMYFAFQPDSATQKSENVAQYNTEAKLAGSYNLPANLQLPHSLNNFQFRFATLNPVKLDTIWFRYMLEGADQTWSNRTSEGSTGNYFGLRPGSYTFKVAALSDDGTWGAPASFTFSILPPWWQTWWARTLFMLLFIAVIWGFVYYRSLSLIKEKRVLEDKINARTREVMEQKEEIASQRDNLQHALDDLKSTQSQLVQREKMASLGELTAGIAHEIQNPLNFVNNFSEVNQEMIDELEEELKNGNITEALALTGGIKDNEKKINHHGKRADSIVKGMLQHSRNNSGERQPTDINDLADEYLRLSYHGLRAKDKSFNAEMLTHYESGLKKANIVSQDMGRVLLNLYNNAFYAVNDKKKLGIPGFKPTVEVTTSAIPGFIVVKVKDNGTGIPKHLKDKIMQPFFTTKPTGEGTGLGLSLSYDIVVKGHGGKLDVHTVEGEFTEFIIQLPLS